MSWQLLAGIGIGLGTAAFLLALQAWYKAWLDGRDELWRRWRYMAEEKRKTGDPWAETSFPKKKKKT